MNVSNNCYITNNNELQDLFTSKKILLVGPSETLISDCNLINIKNYDYICHLNNHIHHSPIKKCDIIYHNLNTGQYNNNNVNYWIQNGIRIIFSIGLDPLNENNQAFKTEDYSNKKFEEFKKRSNNKIKFNYFSPEFFKGWSEKLNSRPSTGTMAMLHILSFNPKELAVIGIDFYKTSYHYNKGNSLKNRVKGKNIGMHNFDECEKKFKEYARNLPNFTPIGKLKEIIYE